MIRRNPVPSGFCCSAAGCVSPARVFAWVDGGQVCFCLEHLDRAWRYGSTQPIRGAV